MCHYISSFINIIKRNILVQHSKIWLRENERYWRSCAHCFHSASLMMHQLGHSLTHSGLWILKKWHRLFKAFTFETHPQNYRAKREKHFRCVAVIKVKWWCVPSSLDKNRKHKILWNLGHVQKVKTLCYKSLWFGFKPVQWSSVWGRLNFKLWTTKIQNGYRYVYLHNNAI